MTVKIHYHVFDDEGEFWDDKALEHCRLLRQFFGDVLQPIFQRDVQQQQPTAPPPPAPQMTQVTVDCSTIYRRREVVPPAAVPAQQVVSDVVDGAGGGVPAQQVASAATTTTAGEPEYTGKNIDNERVPRSSGRRTPVWPTDSRRSKVQRTTQSSVT